MEDGLDTLGAEDCAVGVDYGSILQAAGGLATAGVSAAEQAKKEDQAKADDAKNVAAAITADQNAAIAMAKADVSAQQKAPSASIDAQASMMAIAAQDRAAAAPMTADGQKKRAQAADDTLANVVKAAQAKPTDLNAQALVKAWTQVANKAHSGAIVASGSGFNALGQESWWTKRVAGPIPGYGVVLLGVGAVTALGLVVKKFFLKG